MHQKKTLHLLHEPLQRATSATMMWSNNNDARGWACEKMSVRANAPPQKESCATANNILDIWMDPQYVWRTLCLHKERKAAVYGHTPRGMLFGQCKHTDKLDEIGHFAGISVLPVKVDCMQHQLSNSWRFVHLHWSNERQNGSIFWEKNSSRVLIGTSNLTWNGT